MRSPRLLLAWFGLTLAWTGRPEAIVAQTPLGTVSGSGQSVTPAYEGWYHNPDGTVSVSFGYFNRNHEEELDIPIGPDNYFAPGPQDRGQPTYFQPRRHWGVFTVVVPSDFHDRLVWTLNNRGKTFAIPANLGPEFEIDALAGEAGSGNTPPVLRFTPEGSEGAGPTGVTGPAMHTRVGEPLTIVVWARDDGRPSGSVVGTGRRDVPVRLTWLKYRGPGHVIFGESSAQVPVEGGSMTTTATFDRVGEYVLRVRANDASGVAGAGHAQCCWTNGYVKVAVTP